MDGTAWKSGGGWRALLPRNDGGSRRAPKDEIHAATVAVGVPRAAASPHVTTDWEGIDAETCD